MTAAVRLALRVTPRAGVDAVDGVDDDGRLQVRVRAVPAAGAANAAALKIVAAALDVAPSRIRLLAGAGGRHKLIEVADVEPAVVADRWPGLAVSAQAPRSAGGRARRHPR